MGLLKDALGLLIAAVTVALLAGAVMFFVLRFADWYERRFPL